MGTESTSKGKGGICKGIIAFYVYVYVKKKVFFNSFKFSVLYVLREGGDCILLYCNIERDHHDTGANGENSEKGSISSLTTRVKYT